MSTSKIVYLTGLNGFRAMAALSVLVSHTFSPEFGNFGLPEPAMMKTPTAQFGVTLFFVISGFLITYLLLIELRKQDHISIKKFYIRRILRIWPLYYLFIGIIVLISVTSGYLANILSPQLFWYIFFAANVPFIQSLGISVVAHYWSIGVEEQFYLIWPWLVNMAKSKLLSLTILMVIVLVASKLMAWLFLGKDSIVYLTLSVTRFQCMFVGAIGAILFYEQNVQIIRLATHKITQMATWVVFLVIGAGIIYLPAPVAHEIFSVLSLILILGQVTTRAKIINLEGPIADFLGKISYGIYVYHPLIIFLLSLLIKDIKMDNSLKYMLIYTNVIMLTIVTAYISYSSFEKPFLRKKDKFAVVKSSASRTNNELVT